MLDEYNFKLILYNVKNANSLRTKLNISSITTISYNSSNLNSKVSKWVMSRSKNNLTKT